MRVDDVTAGLHVQEIPLPTSLTVRPGAPPGLVVGARLPAPDEEAVRMFASAARAASTLRVYDRCWRTFGEWLDAHGLPHPAPGQAYPKEIVPSYLVALAEDGYKPGTIEKHLSTICVAFRKLGLPDPRPCTEDTMAGIRRTLGVAPNQKAALTRDLLERVVSALPLNTTRGVRDRAIILFGLRTALRRRDIVRTTREEIAFLSNGSLFFRTNRVMKTNQTGDWQEWTIDPLPGSSLCAVKAMRDWFAVSGVTTGPIFRYISRDGKQLMRPLHAEGGDVAEIVKYSCEAAGLDPSVFAGHSLRAGFVTQAVLSGMGMPEIMENTKHTSTDTVMGYFRRVKGTQTDVSQRLFGRKGEG